MMTMTKIIMALVMTIMRMIDHDNNNNENYHDQDIHNNDDHDNECGWPE